MTATRRRLSTMCLTALLLPATAGAQTVASSFDELKQILNVGDTVTVTESNGHRTKGHVMGVANGFLMIEKGSTTSTFAQATVATITRRDSPIEGLLIGASAGLVGGLLFSSGNCGSDSECTAIALPVGLLVFVPVGAVAGALIDKYTAGDRVYRAPGSKKSSMVIVPAVGKHANGFAVVLRF